jgi:hypothetical protein
MIELAETNYDDEEATICNHQKWGITGAKIRRIVSRRSELKCKNKPI